MHVNMDFAMPFNKKMNVETHVVKSKYALATNASPLMIQSINSAKTFNVHKNKPVSSENVWMANYNLSATSQTVQEMNTVLWVFALAVPSDRMWNLVPKSNVSLVMSVSMETVLIQLWSWSDTARRSNVREI